METSNGHAFEDILNSDEIKESEKKVAGKIASLRILKNGKSYVVGLMETLRNKNIPPKKNRKSKKVQSLGLTNDEGLAYGNVFIYEKKRGILMYEVNKFGCFVNHFLEYLYKCCRDTEDYTDVNFEIIPLLKADEYRRMIDMRYHKSLEVEFSNPSEILEAYTHKNDALWNLFNTGKSTHSERVKAKFEVLLSGGSNGLAINPIKQIIDRTRTLINGPNGANVEKLVVQGYETDSDDGKLSAIDLIADRLLKEIELDEPRDNSDLLEFQRQTQIESLYKSCLDEFDEILGDE